jgi:predicted transcriptional regulator
MTLRCEAIGKYLLPLFRSLVAKELINNYYLTQVEVAKKLGTTQAAISQYVNSKRAYKGAEQFEDILPRLETMAKNAAKCLANGELNLEKISVDFCKLCSSSCTSETGQTDVDYCI